MNVNFACLLLLLLPTFLRNGALVYFLNAVSEVLSYNKDTLDEYFNDINYHVRVTPQVFSLEKMLNDKCDPLLRRIYIKAVEPEPAFYFTTNKNPELQYFCDGEYFMYSTNYAYDFAVYVPPSLKSEDMENYIYALLDKYKLLNKSPKIIYI